MNAKSMLRNIIVFTFLFASAATASTPCDEVDRKLTAERRIALTPEIAKQLHVSKLDVLESFKRDGWYIIYVNTYQSDNAFLFYANEPLLGTYVTLWSGSAQRSEENEIKDWALKNAHGIPLNLASCFAWHVTKDRDL